MYTLFVEINCLCCLPFHTFTFVLSLHYKYEHIFQQKLLVRSSRRIVHELYGNSNEVGVQENFFTDLWKVVMRIELQYAKISRPTANHDITNHTWSIYIKNVIWWILFCSIFLTFKKWIQTGPLNWQVIQLTYKIFNSG